MSNWTHVAAIARIDEIRFDATETIDFTEIFGKSVHYGSPSEVWDDVERHPESFLPMGSEGSLNMSVWINPDISHMAAYVVSIFGDLRDHDDPDEIVEWFKNKLKDLAVRQAIITVENERYGTRSWTMEEEK